MEKKLFITITLLFIVCSFISCGESNINSQLQNGKTKNDSSQHTSEKEVKSHPVKFRGVNWADKRDNFVNGKLLLSGLLFTDSKKVLQKKTDEIIKGFKRNMDANTVRLPINPLTVLGSWWNSYQVVINEILQNKMNVILSVWEGRPRDGRIDNMEKFWSMWRKVVDTYKDSSGVYMELFNEPYGYSVSALSAIYEKWLDKFPAMPRERVILKGIGYANGVKSIGAKVECSECLLSAHFYPFYANHRTPVQWEKDLLNHIGRKNISRTIVTEFGSKMLTGLNYTSPANGDKQVSYLQGMTDAFYNYHISSVYWAGLRISGQYIIQKLNFSGKGLSLTTTNKSGLKRIQFGWGLVAGPFNPQARYKLINKNSGYALGVKQNSVKKSTQIIQEKVKKDADQLWKIKVSGIGYFRLVNKKSGLVLDVHGASNKTGEKVIQWPFNAGKNQVWKIIKKDKHNTKIFYILKNQNSDLVLSVEQKSLKPNANIVQLPYNESSNELWEIKKIKH